MEEGSSFFNKDSLILKPPKKSPLLLRMIVLVISMICVCFFYSKQLLEFHNNLKLMKNGLQVGVHAEPPLAILRDSQKKLENELQAGVHAKPPLAILRDSQKNLENELTVDSSDDHHKVPRSEIPYVHYPNPTTYRGGKNNSLVVNRDEGFTNLASNNSAILVRNESRCMLVRFFAILSMQRSGSAWFQTLLNSHPNISSHGEIFYSIERRGNMSAIARTLDKVFRSASKNKCASAIGLKWMLNQGLVAHHEEITKYFNRRGVSVIFLFRRNLLRRMISNLANKHGTKFKQLNGKHKAHVRSQDEANVLAEYKPKINIKKLIPAFRNATKSADDALVYFKSTRHIVLFYEDLIQNGTKLSDIQRFLGVPERSLSSQYVKIHTRPLSKLVENWGDVYRALKGTQYGSFLNSYEY